MKRDINTNQAKIIYYASFALIYPIFLHRKKVKYINENIEILNCIRTNMSATFKTHQKELQILLESSESDAMPKRIKNKITELINFKANFKDTNRLEILSKSVNEEVLGCNKISPNIRRNFLFKSKLHKQQIELYRGTYFAIYVKLERKMKCFPYMFLIKAFDIESLKIN